MTTVTIYQTKNGIYKGFELSGHAGYAKSGADIVCAAISMLTTNTINSIETFTDDFFSYEENEETGYMKLMLDENASDKFHGSRFITTGKKLQKICTIKKQGGVTHVKLKPSILRS